MFVIIWDDGVLWNRYRYWTTREAAEKAKANFDNRLRVVELEPHPE